MSTVLQGVNSELASLVEDVGQGLVQVRSNGRGLGAGAVWHADGLILTNAHVVRDRAPTVVLADGTILPAKVLAYDEDSDLAALSIDATGLRTVTIGDSRSLRAGEWVFALGHPWGVASSVTAGVVIGGGAPTLGTPRRRRDWIIASLPLRPGYSGGPLLDAQGRVVGINTMVTGPKVGMAVPLHVVKSFLHDTLGKDSF
jgi:serine protease Do